EQGKSHMADRSLNPMDAFKATTNGSFPDLFARAIQDADDYDPRFRSLSVGFSMWSGREDAHEVLIKQLGVEKDAKMCQALVGGLNSQALMGGALNLDDKDVDGLASALQTQQDPAARRSIV